MKHLDKTAGSTIKRLQPKMVDPRDDVARQARAGSVAAIIQLLNEKLASNGIRTRAVREGSLLQLLCEAETAEQLEQATLVARIREILESIGPHEIRRVKINSRLVREQQLLWLEEINRDPYNQLLWSEEIKLSRRNPFKHLATDFKERKTKPIKQSLPKAFSSPFVRDRRQWMRGMAGGVLLSLLTLLVGWGIYQWWVGQQGNQAQVNTPTSSASPSPTQPQPNAATNASNSSNPKSPNEDPFVIAVRLAEQAAALGKTAQSRVQWLEIAARWQKASDLMAQVPQTDHRYQTAQNRKTLYRQNSQAAQQQADKRRS